MNRLREIRKGNNETQETLGHFLNVSKGTISRYENGSLEIPTNSLIKLSKRYDCSIDYILGLSFLKNISENPSVKAIYLLNKLGIDESLTEDNVKKISEYIEFIKQQEKK